MTTDERAQAAQTGVQTSRGLWELADEPQIRAILLQHALRGVRVQVAVRLVLAAFTVATVVIEPPAHDRLACWLIATSYLVGAVVIAVAGLGRDEVAARFGWLALFVDLFALASLTIVASSSDTQSWTADILVNGLFLLPMLAATQLRPTVCAAVAVPTVLVYLGSGASARQANVEPWSSVLLRTAALAGLAMGCVLLSRVQRSRVVTIGSLAADRQDLLEQTQRIEQRERREVAETLHDGALQYLLAARQDLADARASGDPASFERVGQALTESTTLLRSTMTDLHPAVLAQGGLAATLDDIVLRLARRTGLAATLDSSQWPVELRTTADPLLFATARELLVNVEKHAQASRVEVSLSWRDGSARLRVCDNGRGLSQQEAERQLARGHVGLASRRTRVRAAGGDLQVTGTPGEGTVATVTLPASKLSPGMPND